MTRPDNISQDAWAIAWRLHGFTEYDEVVARGGSVAELHAAVDHDVALIARAIMAAQATQREDDALIAERFNDATYRVPTSPDAIRIAAAIRKGDEK